MLGALIFTTLIETLGLGPAPLSCDFPGNGIEGTSVTVEIRARPSLKDQPGLFRALMDVEADSAPIRIRAAAQPLEPGSARGFLVSGRTGDATHYVIGVDAKGEAAFSVTHLDREPPLQLTRTGSCRNHTRYIRRWAPA